MSMKPSRKNIKSILQTSLIVLLFIGYVGATSSPLTNTQGEAGSFVKNCTWTIYLAGDGSTILSNYGGTTSSYTNGLNVFSNTNFTKVWGSTLNAINGGGGTVCLNNMFTTANNLAASSLVTPNNAWNNLWILGNGNSGIKFTTGGSWTPAVAVSNTTWANNIIDGNQQAAFMYANVGKNLNLYYNNIRNCGIDCVRYNQISGGSILGNTFWNEGIIGSTTVDAINLCCSSNYIQIEGNNFREITGQAIGNVDAFETITGNSFYNAYGDTFGWAIRGQQLNYTVVSGNQFYYSRFKGDPETGSAVYTTGSHWSITGNTFDIAISTNTVFGGYQMAIWLDECVIGGVACGSLYNVVSGNTIRMAFSGTGWSAVRGIVLGGQVQTQVPYFNVVSNNAISIQMNPSATNVGTCIDDFNMEYTVISGNSCYVNSSNLDGIEVANGLNQWSVGSMTITNNVFGGVGGGNTNYLGVRAGGLFDLLSGPYSLIQGNVGVSPKIGQQGYFSGTNPFGIHPYFACKTSGGSPGWYMFTPYLNSGSGCPAGGSAVNTLVADSLFYPDFVPVVMNATVATGACTFSITASQNSFGSPPPFQTGLTVLTQMRLEVGWQLYVVGAGPCTFNKIQVWFG